jgi:hypothetical protein
VAELSEDGEGKSWNADLGAGRSGIRIDGGLFNSRFLGSIERWLPCAAPSVAFTMRNLECPDSVGLSFTSLLSTEMAGRFDPSRADWSILTFLCAGWSIPLFGLVGAANRDIFLSILVLELMCNFFIIRFRWNSCTAAHGGLRVCRRTIVALD